jgi:hypothetical protein
VVGGGQQFWKHSQSGEADICGATLRLNIFISPVLEGRCGFGIVFKIDLITLDIREQSVFETTSSLNI